MRFLDTTECYSAVRKEEIRPFATTWLGLDNVVLREISQSEKPSDFTQMWDIKPKLTNIDSIVVVAREKRVGGGGGGPYTW